jgi:putative endonuclease
MAKHNETGTAGEVLAAAHLRGKGYEVLETNWRFKNLEADIIARKDDVIIVAEVKTRSSNRYGEPATFVNRQKQANLVKTANEYMLRHGLDQEVRFDIISIVSVNGQSQITHIERAFYPLLRR